MATTSPNNIYYPVSTNDITPLETVFSTLASSVQTAFNTVKTTTDGLNTRVTALETATNNMDKLPRAVATGSLGATSVGAGAVVTTSVSFPGGRFSSAPVVVVSQNGGARDTVAFPSSVTSTGFTMNRGSNSTVTRSVGAYWVAILY